MRLRVREEGGVSELDMSGMRENHRDHSTRT